MQLLIKFGAPVFDDDMAAMGIKSLPKCRKDDVSGGDEKQSWGNFG
jgi:hypothetical protein